MSTRVLQAAEPGVDVLRHEPIAKRIRAMVDGVTVVDSVQAMLVWQPRRLLCEYAVPIGDVAAALVPARPTGEDVEVPAEGPLFPNVPFAGHSTDGDSYDVRIGDRILEGAAFRPADDDLAGLVVLDFDAFDRWFHEDEENIGHPRDPFHRIDTYLTSRQVTVTRDGVVLAESTRAQALFEAGLPTRYYLPREDVRVELTPTDTRSVCAYKGRASYWSADVGGSTLTDVAWSYEEPLDDAQRIARMVSFDDRHVEVGVADR